MSNLSVLEIADHEGVSDLPRVLQRVTVDDERRSAFEKSPSTYLTHEGIDNVSVRVGDDSIGIHDLLESVARSARLAVAKTVAARVRHEPSSTGEPQPRIVVPLANVVVVVNVVAAANAVAGVNAAANANAAVNTNVRGLADPNVPRSSRPFQRLSLSPKYLAGQVRATLGAQGYSDVRQAALMKSLLDETGASPVGRTVERFKLTHRGVEFEVSVGTDEHGSATVLDAWMLAA
jgi:hypothetical protein